MQEAQDTLDNLKSFVTDPSVLVAPLENEPLLLYIAATTQVVSVVVVERKDEGHV